MRRRFTKLRELRIPLIAICGCLLSLAAAVGAADGPDIELKPAEETQDPNDASGKGGWDVANPPGPMEVVPIDTGEGTWMSVDVSPDGSEIVFDLLGDIYRIPINGGQAEALTEGVPWDIQPRYSPNGRYIAFTSDRGGGDNIWVMDRDGTNPRQVTKEDFRLLNSPVWTPDGQYIAARKHFTSRRSLGAGDIWLYHVSGGEGVQMTKRPNDQKDLGEPAFSTDGRYLFYSQSGIFNGRAISVLQPGRNARQHVRIQQRLQHGDLRDSAAGSRDRGY